MKHIIALFLIIILSFGCYACGIWGVKEFIGISIIKFGLVELFFSLVFIIALIAIVFLIYVMLILINKKDGNTIIGKRK